MGSCSLCSCFIRGSCSEQRTDCSARWFAQVILHIYTFSKEKKKHRWEKKKKPQSVGREKENFPWILFPVLWAELSGAFRVKVSSDNNFTFSREMSHWEGSMWGRRSSYVYRVGKQSVINKVKHQTPTPSLLSLLFHLPQLISWSDAIGCTVLARWPQWTATSSSWPWIKNRLSGRRGLCQTSFIMRRDWCETSPNQSTQKRLGI